MQFAVMGSNKFSLEWEVSHICGERPRRKNNSPQKITLPRVICTYHQRHRAQPALRIQEGAVVLEMDFGEERHGRM